ncbi:hypothetical protein B0H14DRAFT_1468820 [Mycena olivaceomarginata]|nr:hypothetical protein B0H14DRAFT_1468820 [Mycena olivaceomarginata]
MYPGLKLVCLGIIGLSFTPHLCIRDAAQRGIILDSVQLRVAPNCYYLGLSATLCCAESYYLDSGGLLWIERDLALRLILSFGSGGLLWIQRNLALRRILLFGLWGIIMD